MVLKITVSPKPTRGALLVALEEIKQQIALGTLSGAFAFTHSYIATGHRESDPYRCDWATTDKGK
jgi:hypothetical protein